MRQQTRSSLQSYIYENAQIFRPPLFWGQRRGQAIKHSWTAWPLKMGPIGWPETSVSNYRSTLHSMPEKRNLIYSWAENLISKLLKDGEFFFFFLRSREDRRLSGAVNRFVLIKGTYKWILTFEACSQNFEKRLLASSCLSVPWPTVRKLQPGSHWTDFHEIWYLNIFRKRIKKIQVSLQPDKNNSHFTWTLMYFCDNISLNSS